MTENQLKEALARVEKLIFQSEAKMTLDLPKPDRIELANLICDAYALRADLLRALGRTYTPLKTTSKEENTVAFPLKNNTTTNKSRSENIFSNDANLWQYHVVGRDKDQYQQTKNEYSENIMENNIIKTWNGRTIRIRSDRYVSLTDMAKASDKSFRHWNENKATHSYLAALSGVVGIPTTDLVQVFQGGDPQKQGTWGHPKVALRFAQWCSDEFAVQVDFWIDELLTTGHVDLNDSEPLDFSRMPQTFLELAEAWVGQMKENQKLLTEIKTIKGRNIVLEEEASWANSCLKEYRSENEEISERLRIAESKARAYDDCINLDEWVTGSELARRLSRNLKSNKFGTPTLYSILRENGALVKYKGSNINLPSELWASKGLIKFDSCVLFSPKGCVQTLIVFKQDKYADRFPELKESSIDPEQQVSSLSFLG